MAHVRLFGTLPSRVRSRRAAPPSLSLARAIQAHAPKATGRRGLCCAPSSGSGGWASEKGG
eukprot:710942-Prymnesium_polylepis.1